MKLRAYADDTYGFPPAARSDRRLRAGLCLARLFRRIRDYDWERAIPGLERALDAFCVGVIILAVLYFLPILFLRY
ncbi:MAG: hypothetical protein QM278_08000 [Pseudomonadota bacterium]|nr:hypothetical protein [Pseudomonadota bacterium]